MRRPRAKAGAPRWRLSLPQIGLLAGGLVLAGVTSAHALAMATRMLRPQVALAILPAEPIALIRDAQMRLILALEDKRPAPPTHAAARHSLAGQAVNPLALRMLALPERGPLDRNIDYRLAHLSNAVSRRDFPTQALLIQEGVQKNDLGAVLAAYDRALRTKGESQPLLFPQLLKAVEMPAMGPHFAGYLRRRPPWLSAFLVYASSTSERPDVLARLLMANGGVAGLDRAEEIEIGLINRLITARQDYAGARSYYLSTPGAREDVLRTPAIRPATVEPSANALLWQLYEQPGRGAESLVGRAISAYAEAGRSGAVAQKALYLAPGRYRLTARYEDVRLEEGGEATWTVYCAGRSQRELASSRLPERDGAYSSAFDFPVPADCDAVNLILGMSGGEGATGGELIVASLALARTN